jgi:hypothetical protein
VYQYYRELLFDMWSNWHGGSAARAIERIEKKKQVSTRLSNPSTAVASTTPPSPPLLTTHTKEAMAGLVQPNQWVAFKLPSDSTKILKVEPKTYVLVL